MVRRVTKTPIATAKTQKPVTPFLDPELTGLMVSNGFPADAVRVWRVQVWIVDDSRRLPTVRTRELADPASRVGP
jgi:hypothetical protein